MLHKLAQKRYQLDIPGQVWSDFFRQFMDENRGRYITLTSADRQPGDVALLGNQRLVSVAYAPPLHGNDLLVVVSHTLNSRKVTDAYAIVDPQMVQIVTDDNAVIQTCTITDAAQAQAIICFE